MEYSDPRSKMRVARTYFLTSNYKERRNLKEHLDDEDFLESYICDMVPNPDFTEEEFGLESSCLISLVSLSSSTGR